MSWHRRIKLIYTITLSIFFYIIFSASFALISRISMDYKFFMLIMLCGVAIQYLSYKEINKKLSFFLICLFSIAYLIFMKQEGLVASTICLVFIVGIFQKDEMEVVNYYAYKKRAKVAVITLIILGLAVQLITPEMAKNIFRFYIMFIICIVIVLREGRRYHFKIVNKKSVINNIVIAITILIFSFEKVFSTIINGLNYILNSIAPFIGKIIYFIVWPVARVVGELVYLILKAITKNTSEWEKLDIKTPSMEKIKAQPNEIKVLPNYVIVGTKILLICGILLLLYKLYVYTKTQHIEDVFEKEEYEKISKDKIGKKPSLINKILSRFKSVDRREQILQTYRKFQIKAKKKDIFKEYMTATQLGNVMKSKVKQEKEIDTMTLVYNEAKFSEHEIEIEKVKSIETSYDKLKRELQ